MRTLGIVGGIGPESTIDYYRSLIAAYRARVQDGSYPSILINSIDVSAMLELVARQELRELASWLGGAVEALAQGGADFALIAANTPHLVFDAVAQRSSIPLVSIVTATRDAVLAGGHRRPALIGTRFTMTGGFYQRVFDAAGIELVLPDPEEQSFIHEKYIGELVNGNFVAATRDRLVEIFDGMQTRDGIDAVILAGTELPLILRDSKVSVPVLDTTQIHVAAAVAQMFA